SLARTFPTSTRTAWQRTWAAHCTEALGTHLGLVSPSNCSPLGQKDTATVHLCLLQRKRLASRAVDRCALTGSATSHRRPTGMEISNRMILGFCRTSRLTVLLSRPTQRPRRTSSKEPRTGPS